MKHGMMIVAILVVAVAITFFSFFWPLNNADSAAGTPGGIEKFFSSPQAEQLNMKQVT